MKNLKKYATTLALAGIIMMGVTTSKAGIFMSDLKGGDQPCTTGKDGRVDSGIIVAGITGIIVAGFTGILMSDVRGQNCTQVDNGILMAD